MTRTTNPLPSTRPSRVVVEPVRPLVDGGAFATKATLGEPMHVLADVFADGHDVVDAVVTWRHLDATGAATAWEELSMAPLGNDRFEAWIVPDRLGRLEYDVVGWIDHLESWRRGVVKKIDAGVDVSVELLTGAGLLADVLERAVSLDDDHSLSDHRLVKALRAQLLAGDHSTLDDDHWTDVFARTSLREPTGRLDTPHARRCRPPAGSHRRLVRVLSPLECRRDTATNAARLDRPARPRRCDGVRRRLSATDPSDRALAPEGPQRDDIARARRRRQPVGDRLRGRRPHGCQSGPRDHRRRHRLRIGVPRPRHGTGTRHRVPVLSRSPVGDRAPRVVRETGRRQHPVRREPAQEVPGHLSDRLRVRRLAEPVGSVGRRHPLLDRARGADVPRRQPSHQGLCVLGVGSRFDPQRVPRHGLPRRGIHPSPGDGAPRQDRVQPVVHVLRVAPSRLGTAGVLRGPVDSDRRCVPPERLAQHAGHPDRATPDRRSADVRDSSDPGGHALAELGRLRAGLRATRARTGARGLRGVPRLREVPDPHVGSRPPRHDRPAAHSAQRDSPRAPSVQAARHDPLPRDRRQRPALFQQDGPRRRRRRGVGRRQPRSVRTPQRFRQHRPCRTRAPRRLRLRRGRRARWRHLPLERQPQLRRSCAMVGVGPHLHRPPDHRPHPINEQQETAP